MPRITNATPALIVFGLLMLAGCGGGPRYMPVEGTLSRDGKPLAYVEISFLSDEGMRLPRSRALTDEDGRFRLTTDDGEKIGAPAGRYRVCLHDRKPGGSNPAIPNKYAIVKETPLRAEVKDGVEGVQVIDFNLP